MPPSSATHARVAVLASPDLVAHVLGMLETHALRCATVCHVWHGAVLELSRRLHVLALSGGNGSGQLGRATFGTELSLQRLKMPAAAGGRQVTQVVCGHYHTFVVTSDGTLWSCGRNDHGQLGRVESLRQPILRPVTLATSAPLADAPETALVQSISGGQEHTCIVVGGVLLGCGSNKMGQLGNDPSSASRRAELRASLPNVTRMTRLDGIATATHVSCGQHHTAVLLADGSLRTSGVNYVGQLGLGEAGPTLTTSFRPVLAPHEGCRFAKVACGKGSTFALTTAGELWACGWNNCGQLGLGAPRLPAPSASEPARADHGAGHGADHGVVDAAQPEAVPLLTRVLLPEGLACVAEVSSGAVHTCVLSAEGRLFGCGYNGHGQLGHGLVPTSVAAGPKQWALAPMPLPGALQTVRSVTCGYEHTCVLKADRTLWTCGRNKSGTCALGTATLREPAFRRVRLVGATQPQPPAGWRVAFASVSCGNGGAGGHTAVLYTLEREGAEVSAEYSTAPDT